VRVFALADRSIEVGAAAAKLVKRHRVGRRDAGRAATATRLQPHHRRARGRGDHDRGDQQRRVTSPRARRERSARRPAVRRDPLSRAPRLWLVNHIIATIPTGQASRVAGARLSTT